MRQRDAAPTTEQLRVQYAQYVKKTIDAHNTPLSYNAWKVSR